MLAYGGVLYSEPKPALDLLPFWYKRNPLWNAARARLAKGWIQFFKRNPFTIKKLKSPSILQEKSFEKLSAFKFIREKL